MGTFIGECLIIESVGPLLIDFLIFCCFRAPYIHLFIFSYLLMDFLVFCCFRAPYIHLFIFSYQGMFSIDFPRRGMAGERLNASVHFIRYHQTLLRRSVCAVLLSSSLWKWLLPQAHQQYVTKLWDFCQSCRWIKQYLSVILFSISLILSQIKLFFHVVKKHFHFFLLVN